MDFTDDLLKDLKKTRLEHTMNVRDMAVELADTYGADREKASRAALYHDICKGRAFTDDVMNGLVRKYGLDEKYLNNTALSHSKVAACLLKDRYGVSDEEILDAVRNHTTGRAGMSLLEKIIFIADAAEKGRDYPGVEKVRELAYKDIDKACLAALENTIGFIRSSGGVLDEDSLHTRDYFLKMEKEREKNG